jgi:predicted RNA-binding Zn-ribbon protein involved in translation (DUF1610 family)
VVNITRTALSNRGWNINNQNTFKMKILPSRPIEGTIFSKDNFAQERRMEPFVTGEGVIDYQCGSCGHFMLKSLRWAQVTQAVYKCPKCGNYNQIEPIGRRH